MKSRTSLKESRAADVVTVSIVLLIVLVATVVCKSDRVVCFIAEKRIEFEMMKMNERDIELMRV